MTKLKLGAIADDKPIRVTVELPAALHRDLVAYAKVLVFANMGAAEMPHTTAAAMRPLPILMFVLLAPWPANPPRRSIRLVGKRSRVRRG
ncbi:DUF2274 domain-containing protein [Bradyrhizobium sp. 48]|uniref:DUF2274 domain-containing protein n=1 Tax=Bradyrhizobium sp. 48 TaxID=2782676 RepID=UPI001FF9E285|nr:DUF2274 domain-containing protein [Bradyrhizobium sp. 48]